MQRSCRFTRSPRVRSISRVHLKITLSFTNISHVLLCRARPLQSTRPYPTFMRMRRSSSRSHRVCRKPILSLLSLSLQLSASPLLRRFCRLRSLLSRTAVHSAARAVYAVACCSNPVHGHYVICAPTCGAVRVASACRVIVCCATAGRVYPTCLSHCLAARRVRRRLE